MRLLQILNLNSQKYLKKDKVPKFLEWIKIKVVLYLGKLFQVLQVVMMDYGQIVKQVGESKSYPSQ